MLRAFGLGATLFGFWLLLSGHYTPLLIGLGVASCVLVVFLCVRMEVVDHESVSLHANWRFWSYVPWLMKEILVSNVTVAKIILDPALPISPRMVRYHASQKTDLGKALYANSITLTPGTVTTSVEGQELLVHMLAAGQTEVVEQDDMDRRCAWVEQG